MDHSKTSHIIPIFADLSTVKDILKGILHTIFFHRHLPATRPIDRDVLSLTLPAVDDIDITTLIDVQSTALVRSMEISASSASHPYASSSGSSRGQLLVQFFHQVKKPTQVPRGLSYFGFGAGREKVEMEDVCWEQWTIDVTLARPRDEEEMRKLRVAMEASLEKAVLKVLSTSCEEKEKVPVGVGKEGEAGGYKIVLGGGTRGRS